MHAAGWSECKQILQRINRVVSAARPVSSRPGWHVRRLRGPGRVRGIGRRRACCADRRGPSASPSVGSAHLRASRSMHVLCSACIAGDRAAAIEGLRTLLGSQWLTPTYEQPGRAGALASCWADDEGAELVHASDVWLRGRGVVDPERFTTIDDAGHSRSVSYRCHISGAGTPPWQPDLERPKAMRHARVFLVITSLLQGCAATAPGQAVGSAGIAGVTAANGGAAQAVSQAAKPVTGGSVATGADAGSAGHAAGGSDAGPTAGTHASDAVPTRTSPMQLTSPMPAASTPSTACARARAGRTSPRHAGAAGATNAPRA